MRTYDDRSGMRRGPLAERLLAVAVLVALWLLLSALVVWGAQPDPAGAFPADTLLYLDLRQPVDTLDTLSGMPPWQAVEDLVGAAADTGMDGDGVAAALRRLMAAWHGDVQLHVQLRALAGERLLFAIVPGAAGGPASPVVALRGGRAGAQLEALAALLLRLGPRATGEIRWTGDAFELMSADGTPVLELRMAAGWLLLGRAGDDSPLSFIAEALASEEVGPGSLATLGAYGDAMARLPATPAVLGFVNVPAIAAQADTMTGLSASTARLIHQMPGCFDGFGFSRELGPDVIRTRVAGRLAADPQDGPLFNLLHSLAPLSDPLSRRLPAEALATHDLGAAPGDVYGLVASVLRAVNHGEEGGSGTFGEASGLDPATDLFPYLGGRVASALLPAAGISGETQLPRPVAVTVVYDETAVRAFLDTFLRWEAGDVAARSQGLVSATVVTETYEGVTIRGLQIESVVPSVLPSPAYAVVDGLLVVSPMRSEVRDAVSSIHATADTVVPPIEGSPVELFHGDLCALAGELGRGLLPLLSRLREGDGLPVVGPRLDQLTRLAPPLLALVGSLGQADGWTTLARDGTFDATFELHPRECATGLDQPQQGRPAARRARPALGE
jgi:hypothetical protein